MSLHLVMFLIALIWVAVFAFYLYTSRDHARVEENLAAVRRLLDQQSERRG